MIYCTYSTNTTTVHYITLCYCYTASDTADLPWPIIRIFLSRAANALASSSFISTLGHFIAVIHRKRTKKIFILHSYCTSKLLSRRPSFVLGRNICPTFFTLNIHKHSKCFRFCRDIGKFIKITVGANNFQDTIGSLFLC